MSEDSLDPLLTQCPNCDTRFRVSESQLQIATGRVRCGACLSVFDGTEHLLMDGEEVHSDPSVDLDDVLAELDEIIATAPAGDEKNDPPVDLVARLGKRGSRAPRPSNIEADVPDELAALEAELLHDLRQAESEIRANDKEKDKEKERVKEKEKEASAEVVAEPLGAVLPESGVTEDLEPTKPVEERTPKVVQLPKASTPSAATVSLPKLTAELEDEANESGPSKFSPLTIATALLLLLGLPAQILWFQYESWVQQPQIRPVYEVACSVLACELPALRDLDAIASRKSVIRAHPELAEARVIDVLMVNGADFAQPFPLIELRATSLEGQLIAGRRFKPEEYLTGEMSADELMPSHTPVHVSLEIQDPSAEAMNFVIEFR